jgi:hypothetical protein
MSFEDKQEEDGFRRYFCNMHQTITGNMSNVCTEAFLKGTIDEHFIRLKFVQVLTVLAIRMHTKGNCMRLRNVEVKRMLY